MRRRQLVAFKRGPTVDLQLDDLKIEVRNARVRLAINDLSEYLSWEEWHELTRRVAHAIQWIQEHTPEDAGVRSVTVESDE